MKIKTIKETGALVLPQLDLWSGRRHLTNAEIGVSLPKGLMTPGSKLVFDKAKIQPLATIKSKTYTAIEKVSVKYGRGAYCMSQEELEKLVPLLDEYNAEFDAILQELSANYDRWFDEWCDTLDPEWQSVIRSSKVPAGDAVSRYQYRWSVLSLAEPETAPAANDRMIGGLVGQLWTELSAIAQHATDDLAGKAKVTQKGKSPIRRIAEKARAVSFIDPRATSLAGYVEKIHDGLPKTGPIEGSDLDTIRVLMHDLSNQSRAIELAEKFGGPILSQDDEDEDTSDGTDEPVSDESEDLDLARYW